MKVRFIGGPADREVLEVDEGSSKVYIQDRGFDLNLDISEEAIPTRHTETVYNIHKLAGDKEVFFFACKGSIDEALERLLYEDTVSR